MKYEIGALYNRAAEIHGVHKGQKQGGISTPAGKPFVFIFLGEAGKTHGYDDNWDDEGVLHYFGEGQGGDMQYRAGNLAIEEHAKKGKALLVFQSLGKGKPYRFLGEHHLLSSYEKSGVRDSTGALRKAIVFRLAPVELETALDTDVTSEVDKDAASAESIETDARRPVLVRTKQGLFRRRVVLVEKGCRITGLKDLRFLRASHIRPWSKCEHSQERLDGNNGLLLCPQADFLFDGGWITFEDTGKLVLSAHLPATVVTCFGLPSPSGKRYGSFNAEQRVYMEFHRNNVFEHKAS